MVKLNKNLDKIASNLIVQMRIKNINLQKFLHFRKVLEFDLSKYLYRRKLQFLRYVLIKCLKVY